MYGDDSPRIEGLDEIYADGRPPPALEDAVVGRLVADGLLEPGGRGRAARLSSTGHSRRGRWFLRVAAGLLLFAGGWVSANAFAPTAPATPADSYMLLLWEAPGFSPEAQPGAIASEYAAWARAIASGGTAISGNELSADRVIAGDVPAGSSVAGGARLGGYFLVAAESQDDAYAMAAGHPHLRHGGWIEVAEIVVR